MKNVEIYTGPLCIFCDWAKKLLERKGVPYKEIYIGDDLDKREEMLKKTNGSKTVPQIFIDGKHIGGNDSLQDLERKGKLNSLLGI